jgi:DNA-binding PadR family transcriptional regulator
MTVSKVEVAVLASLAEEPLHGYDLLVRMKQRGMERWAEVGKASVYQALQRLDRQGLIVGKDHEGTEGPDRRVYRITRTGRDRLRTGLVERFGSTAPYESDAGLALGFVHLLSAAEARRALDAREQALHDFVAAAGLGRARTGADHGAGSTVADAMLVRQTALAEAELMWIKGFRASVVKLSRQPTVG